MLSELIVFQPNEYDNNKLFYVWWALCAVLAADYAVLLYDKLRGLRARRVIAVMTAICCFATGTLSIARECISDFYGGPLQMFSGADAELARWVEDNTEEHATFMCWTHHINPVPALAGRDIVCGPGLWLGMHGYDLRERENDIRAFYGNPREYADVLDKYDVEYIVVGTEERNNAGADADKLLEIYDLVYEGYDGTLIFRVEGAHG